MEGAGLKEYVDYVLAGDAESVGDKVKDILDVIAVNQPDGTVILDTKAINSLVLYIGLSDMEKLEPTSFNPESVQVALLQKLVFGLRPYGRHVFLASIANHLRFPNIHTLYFHNILLHIWDAASGHELQDRIREQVSRVLVERLVVHRPHSWGTILTLLEIFKTRADEFWALPAAHAAPEVRKLLTSLEMRLLTHFR
ncbi:CCR4-Not complex component [Pyronema omphalodes]|nr:CCR4-Not complex component [Pyronema omphalodes]